MRMSSAEASEPVSVWLNTEFEGGRRVENRQLPDGTAGSRKSPVILGLVKI
jgi:hypothetical protein